MSGLAERFTFGHGEHIALRMVQRTAQRTRDESRLPKHAKPTDLEDEDDDDGKTVEELEEERRDARAAHDASRAVELAATPAPEPFDLDRRRRELFKAAVSLRHTGVGREVLKVAVPCLPPARGLDAETIAAVIAAAVETDPFPLTDAGNAECFASLYRDHVRYDHHRGRWLVSDSVSGIWVPDPVERLTQMAINMSRTRQIWTDNIEDTAAKKKAWNLAVKGEERRGITNMLPIARSLPPIADDGLTWDQDAFLLGVQNGVVDLRDGTFRKARPADRVTMRVRVSYDAAATCPLWLETLAGIFAPHDELGPGDGMVGFMQRALGYSITGDCREECCFFVWGDGSNGKGVVMNTIAWLLFDYTDDMPYSTLERSAHGGGIPNDVAKLEGKRFITCAEANEFTLNETRLKALTGRDPMTARFLHKEFFTFIPVGKIWIATNNKPKIAGTDDGIWRRIHLIPFTRKFEGHERNTRLKDQLRDELPGILNWIIAGAVTWLRDGLNPPDVVKAATATYRHDSNPITPFVDACCSTGARQRMQAAVAFKAYQQFCHSTNCEPWLRLSDKAFHKAMRLRFDVETGRQTFYLGVGLRMPSDASGREEF